MRVRLKGINHTTKRLANGTVKHYWYAWRGGALLRGEPGTPEFIASYNEAVARKVTAPEGVLSALIGKFETSPEFERLAPRTQDDYRKQFTLIYRNFGDLPLEALCDPRVRGVFKDWRDEIAKRSLRQADAAWIALARVLSWALDRREIAVNPCERGGRLYHGTRADKVWTLEQESAFLAVASEPLCRAYVLAIWTGQRQGDLSPVILLNSDSKPWTSHGFSSSWRNTTWQDKAQGRARPGWASRLRCPHRSAICSIPPRPRRRSHQRLGTALDKSDQYSTGTTSTAIPHSARTSWRSSKGEQIFQTGSQTGAI
jgi:hypothetical protein